MVAGGATVLLGGDSLPATGDLEANAESELRFYAVWWVGTGLFLAWLAPRVQQRTRELRVFAALLFTAGLSRGLAILDSGWPHWTQSVLMGLELTLPIILITWQARVRVGAQAGSP